MGINLVFHVLNYPINVFTLIGESVMVTHVCHSCPVLFVSFQTWIDLIILDMLDFDVIMGMT